MTSATSDPILVTGASGNVGARVSRLLIEAGLRVRTATRDPLGQTDTEVVPFAFQDPATWDAAYQGVHRMFLMRPPQLGRPRTQMIPSLERARALGVEHVVLLSLQGAERNPVAPHAALERWLRRSGLSWVFVRASFFMQNLTTVHRADIRDRDEIVVPAGRGATAFVDAYDVAAVAAVALIDPVAHCDTASTPTGPEALTHHQVADVVGDVLGRRVTYAEPGPLRYVRHARSVLAMPPAMVAVTTAIYTGVRLGLADRLTDDAERVLGRAPVSFAEFAQREQDAWRR